MTVNIQQFAVTPQSASNINVPRASITAQVFDADTNALLSDFTGANAIQFPSVLSTLTVQQRSDLVNQIAQTIVFMRAGLA